jgi:hypothetical protein
MCHVASKSPLASSPTRDQIIVSHNQKNAQPGPRPINVSVDEESSQSDTSDSAALQREHPMVKNFGFLTMRLTNIHSMVITRWRDILLLRDKMGLFRRNRRRGEETEIGERGRRRRKTKEWKETNSS